MFNVEIYKESCKTPLKDIIGNNHISYIYDREMFEKAMKK